MMLQNMNNYRQQKYLQKLGRTMEHQLCANISSGSSSTFNVQL
jgi:hypothetical protein